MKYNSNEEYNMIMPTIRTDWWRHAHTWRDVGCGGWSRICWVIQWVVRECGDILFSRNFLEKLIGIRKQQIISKLILM